MRNKTGIFESFPFWLRSDSFLIVLTSIWIVSTSNLTFFSLFERAYPWQDGYAFSWFVVVVLYVAVSSLLLGLLAWGRLTKPVLVFFLVLSAVSAAFMDSYGVVLNTEMMRNVVHTNVAEAFDLLNWRFAIYFVVLAVLPATVVWRWKTVQLGWRKVLLHRVVLMASLLALIVALGAVSSGFLISFARNDKKIRKYMNPMYPIYSTIKFSRQMRGAGAEAGSLRLIGEDAQIAPEDKTRDLLVLVVGETARADHFGINGYERDTTPELRKANAISLTDFEACGTSTAYSVPCMFSSAGAARYTPESATREENLLDVLLHAGVHVVWLDNNSSSLGVAERAEFIDFRTSANNHLCDEECRDEGMVLALQRIINRYREGDIVIVLHQMGNHGPAYYKRYPPAFENFSPACHNKDLGQCSREEIVNAYDNAIAYTDHFLGKVIEVLRDNDDEFETALFYFSDHGESLGEGGIYLHGMPKSIAPKAQTHVPGILWFGSAAKRIDTEALRRDSHKARSHDNIFHTVLGFLEIESEVYKPELNILRDATHPRSALLEPSSSSNNGADKARR